MKRLTPPLVSVIVVLFMCACYMSTPYPPTEVVLTEPPVQFPTSDFVPTEPPVVPDTVQAPVGSELSNLAPNFVLSDTYGNTYELWGLRGHPVLLNFWATWCGPCLEEMPALQAIHDRYQGSGLIILAVNGDGESLYDIETYQAENGLSFPLLVDVDQYSSVDYQIEAFPTTFFIDGNGVIQYISDGSMDEQGFDDILNSTNLMDSPRFEDNNGLAIDLPGNVWSVDITESHVYEFSTLSGKLFSNFTVQTDVQINSDVYEYHGLFFRKQDDENFYSFRITPDGYFAFDVWHSGDHSYDTILGPSQSEFISQGGGQINTLRVTASGENFDLYINGQYVGSAADSRFPAGTVGVLSCTCDGSAATSAVYSNFSLVDQP